MKDADALGQIAHLINASQDALSAAGTDRAFAQLDEFGKRTLAPEMAALAHYFRANAWDNRPANFAACEQPLGMGAARASGANPRTEAGDETHRV